MSSKSTYKGAPPKYLNDFSKALASEVRILLGEVGKLRDERRALQFEIAELMSVKSKHGAGGEYAPDWKPKPNEPAPEPDAPPAPPEDLPPAKPAWRVVHKKPERKPRDKQHAPPPGPPPGRGMPPEPPKPSLPAWATWKPNPLIAPTPKMATAGAPLPVPPTPRAAGLFGPSTPPPK